MASVLNVGSRASTSGPIVIEARAWVSVLSGPLQCGPHPACKPAFLRAWFPVLRTFSLAWCPVYRYFLYGYQVILKVCVSASTGTCVDYIYICIWCIWRPEENLQCYASEFCPLWFLRHGLSQIWSSPSRLG